MKEPQHAETVGQYVAPAISGSSLPEAAFATRLLQQLVVPFARTSALCEPVLAVSPQEDSPLQPPALESRFGRLLFQCVRHCETAVRNTCDRHRKLVHS